MSTSTTEYGDFSHLDDKQREAVCSDIQPIVVNAGPGAGKTRVIVERIKFLIQHKNVCADHVLALTFTNNAATEMSDRLHTILRSDKQVHCHTFHAFCLWILRKYGAHIGLNVSFTILAESAKITILKQIQKTHVSVLEFIQEHALEADKMVATKKVAGMIGDAKREGQDAHMFSEMVRKREIRGDCDIQLYEYVAVVYSAYERACAQQHQLDFDDLLLKTLRLFTSTNHVALDEILRTEQLSHVVIDEFQDTNALQFEIAKTLLVRRFALFGDFQSIMCVGDYDQSIFGWRGSQSQKLLQQFKRVFGAYTEVQLHHNYRSTRHILNVANCIINKSTDQHRRDKKMTSETRFSEHAEKVLFEQCKSDQDEAYFVISKISEIYEYAQSSRTPLDLGQIAILYRANTQTRVIEEKLNECALQYNIAGGVSFYQRTEILFLVNILKVIENTHDNHALTKALQSTLWFCKGIGNTLVEKFLTHANNQQLSLQQALFTAGDAVKISGTQREKIKTFVKSLWKMKRVSQNGDNSVSDIIDAILQQVKYKEYIYAMHPRDEPRADEQWQNVCEFMKIATEFDQSQPTQNANSDSDGDDDDEKDNVASNQNTNADRNKLSAFLQHIALVDSSPQPAAAQNESTHPFCRVIGRVQLLTIHKAKGLEWDTVFVIGCSHGLLPHYRALQSSDRKQVEEELRLAFVASTRARKRLFLSYAMYRIECFGDQKLKPTEASRFFQQCPDGSIDYVPYYDGAMHRKKKKQRTNVFLKNGKKRAKKKKNDAASIATRAVTGYRSARDAIFGDANNDNDEEKGRQIRENKAKMVEKFGGVGFQKASSVDGAGQEVQVPKKRKFKPPRKVAEVTTVTKHNQLQHIPIRHSQEVEKQSEGRKRKRTEIEIIEIEDEQPKKKKKKKKNAKALHGQKSITSFFGMKS